MEVIMVDLHEKRERIQKLKKEISILRAKEVEVAKLEEELYNDYFNLEREEYAHLTQIPHTFSINREPMGPYSILNVDLVGKMIAILFKDYENKKMTVMRDSVLEKEQDDDDEYPFWNHFLIIKNALENNENDIIKIEYSHYMSLCEYPTNDPITWIIFPRGREIEASNYNKLIYLTGNLTFDNKNREFIEELVYSLSYYQKKHGIEYMDATKTWDVFKKIYKK